MLTGANPRSILVLVAIAVAFLVPTIVTSSPYHLRVLTNICVFIIVVSGFRLVVSAGQFTMAHAGFIWIGSLTSALLVNKMGWSFWLCLPLAGMVPAMIAVLLGRVTLRLRGIYFAIATFAFTVVIGLVWRTWNTHIHGVRLGPIPAPNPIGGWDFSNMAHYYYCAVVLVLITLLIMYRLARSRFGLTLRCIAASDALAASVGMNAMGYQIAAFAIGSFFAGVGGAFHSHWLRMIDPGMSSFTTLLYIITYAVVGGTRSVMGPVYGCLLLLGMPVLLKYIPDYDPKIEPIIYGSVLVLTVRFMPEGISGLLQRISERVKGAYGRRYKEYAAA